MADLKAPFVSFVYTKEATALVEFGSMPQIAKPL
jgi:hypothetical protein